MPDAGAAEEVDLAPLLGPIPLVAIPIIAGVGAEVTPMATILDDDDPVEPDKVQMPGRTPGGGGVGGLRRCCHLATTAGFMTVAF